MATVRRLALSLPRAFSINNDSTGTGTSGSNEIQQRFFNSCLTLSKVLARLMLFFLKH